MFKSLKVKDREENYRLMTATAKDFIRDETDLVALLSNLSSLVKVYVEDLNWVGFYILKGEDLVLGPFQGFPACSRIGMGKGVCGKAALESSPLIVDDVHQFPGHITCDSDSASEMVIPFFKAGKVYGVLDLDSPMPSRFTDLELKYLGEIVALLTAFLDAS